MTPRQQAALDRVLRTDRRFFKCNPDRNHYVRPAHPVEIAMAISCREPVPAGFVPWVAICQIKPGTRLRAFLVARVGSSPDGDEEEARELFEIAVAPEVGNSPTLH
jgi:hypothetical protein